ncbi:hypothetical protein PENSPDRAFT_229644 [Peniophora sp. CONT]|nr:hypothetical protein PENSPDRAFT_229644 [Peniophora sp. CONT]
MDGPTLFPQFLKTFDLYDLVVCQGRATATSACSTRFRCVSRRTLLFCAEMNPPRATRPPLSCAIHASTEMSSTMYSVFAPHKLCF